MDWVKDLTKKITEGMIAMEEDAFNFLEHQLQTVGNSIENQYQTVSANIENQLQAIRANIQLRCSDFNLDGEISELVNKNIEPMALESSSCSPDLVGEKYCKLTDLENKNIKSTASKSSMLITENNSRKLLEESSSFLDGSDSEKEITNCTEINSGKGVEKYSAFLDDSDSDSSASEIDISTPDMYSEESRERNCAFRHGDVIGKDERESKLDESCAMIDSEKLCSFCLKKFKSDTDKEITCEICAAKSNLIDEQASESGVYNDELNLAEYESFVIADFDCDSDWEII